jgi:hypothetical protein
MSATTQDRRPVTELLNMSEAEAKTQLAYAEYQRWESLNDHHERAEENRRELAEADAEVHDLLINTDPSDLAADVTVWGNDLSVYYGPEDQAIRDAAERLADTFGLDPEDDPEGLTEDDIDESQLDDAKAALADLVCAAVVAWDGTPWDELPEAARADIREQITAPRPDGWGVAGLIDAWTEIQYTVDSNRNDRLERVRKFRTPERRGDR